jgi:hypothetical protein
MAEVGPAVRAVEPSHLLFRWPQVQTPLLCIDPFLLVTGRNLRTDAQLLLKDAANGDSFFVTLALEVAECYLLLAARSHGAQRKRPRLIH